MSASADTPARTGKIARLPRAVRDELNRSLADGEPGDSLLAWLNAHADVRSVLAGCFGGRAVTKQNLSEWRKGGFREWLRHAEAADQVRHALEQAEVWDDGMDDPALSDRMAPLLTGRLVALTVAALAETKDPREGLVHVRAALKELRHLRHFDHQAWRLAVARSERVEARHREQQAAAKARITAPIWNLRRLEILAKHFGGGEAGREIAAFLIEIGQDLPLGSLLGRNGSKPVQPSPTQSNPTPEADPPSGSPS